VAWLPQGEKISKISLFVSAQLTNVTDRRTDRQTDGHRMPAIAALCVASHGKNYDDMLSRFHLIPERYGRRDGQIRYINIARQYADAV